MTQIKLPPGKPARFSRRCGLYQPSLKCEAITNGYVFEIVSGFVAIASYVNGAENATVAEYLTSKSPFNHSVFQSRNFSHASPEMALACLKL